jgi:hypothetical protein
MRAGPCAGVNGTCVRSGWSPNYLVPLSWATTSETLAAGQTVCPFCIVQRAINAGVTGFNNSRRTRVYARLDGFHCMRPGGSRSVGHTHLFDFVGESLITSRDASPGISERGY